MITDEQGRMWMFKKLYDAGWRYCVMDNFNDLYLKNCKKAMSASAFKNILPELKPNECISIAEELGIVDWSKVPVDTPVRVWNNESTTKEKRHFAGYENGYVLTWPHGGTSWSSPKHCVSEWDHAELVEL